MKTHCRSHVLTAFLALLFLVLAGCATVADEEVAEAAQEAGPLSDGDIVAVLRNLNRADIEHAQLALDRGSDPSVEIFANRMLEQHQALDERLAEISRQEGIQPTENPLSQEITQEADTMGSELQGLTGDDFDRAYLESQAALHETGSAVAEEHLMMDVRNPRLSAFLQTASHQLAHHQRVAEERLGEL